MHLVHKCNGVWHMNTLESSHVPKFAAHGEPAAADIRSCGACFCLVLSRGNMTAMAESDATLYTHVQHAQCSLAKISLS